jgi:hypothetical protein
MRTASLLLLTLPLASCAVDEDEALDTVAQASVAASWDGDYETGSISQWADGVDDGLPACTGNWIDVVTSPLRQGSYVGRFELDPSCVFDSNTSDITDDRQKIEISSTPDQTNGYQGADAYYGWSFLLPTTTPMVLKELPTTITQWKVADVSGGCDRQPSENVGLTVYKLKDDSVETLWLTVGGGSCGTAETNPISVRLGNVVHGEWQDLVMRAHWSSGADGLIELWWNGTKVASVTNPNLFDDGAETNPTVNPVRVRQGAYRRRCRYQYYDDDNNPMTPEVPDPNSPHVCDDRDWVVYLDAMRRSSNYQDVALPNFNFERWVTSSSPLSWLSTGSTGFTSTTFARYATSSWSPLGCSTGTSGSYSLRIAGRHDATSTALARGVRQEDGVKGTRVAPGRNYQVRANLCSIDPPASRGYRLRVFWFRADGSPSSTVSSTGSEAGLGTHGVVQPRFNVTSPADAAFGRVQVEAVSTTPNDTVDYAVDLVGLWNN